MTDHDQLDHPDDRPIDWLAALPPVDPPPGFLDGVIRKAVVRRFAAASALVGLSVVVGAMLVSNRYGREPGRIEPPVEQFVARHTAIVDGPDATATGWQAVQRVEPPFVLAVAPFAGAAEGAWWSEGHGALQVLLDGGVSVFEQIGRLGGAIERFEVAERVAVPGCDNEAAIVRVAAEAYVAVLDCEGLALTFVARRHSHLVECVRNVVAPEPLRLGQNVHHSARLLLGLTGP